VVPTNSTTSALLGSADHTMHHDLRHDPVCRRGGKAAAMTEKHNPITTLAEFERELEALMMRASGVSNRERLKLLKSWCDYLIEAEGVGGRVFVRADDEKAPLG
jgi:hypothetical protein